METIFLNPTSGLTHECAETGHCCACRSWLTCTLIAFVTCSHGTEPIQAEQIQAWTQTAQADKQLCPCSDTGQSVHTLCLGLYI